MIKKLQQIEDKVLLGLLQDPNNWQSIMIDYHPPIVERIWAQIGNYRVLLHWIHACKTEEALFHPHPWPSAMHVISGKYEMGLGYGKGLEEPSKICTIVLENGGAYYDMTHIDGWHYVRPIGEICVTAMLIGPKWDREEIKSDEPLKPLSNDRKLIMVEFFRNYYQNRLATQKISLLKDLKHGDWVRLDEKAMTSQDHRYLGKYIDDMAFVIKVDKGFADIRFKESGDRVLSHIKNLILLDSKDKPVVEKKDTTEVPQEKPQIGMILEDSDLIDNDEFGSNEDLDEKNI